jgi:hypothetical protein
VSVFSTFFFLSLSFLFLSWVWVTLNCCVSHSFSAFCLLVLPTKKARILLCLDSL